MDESENQFFFPCDTHNFRTSYACGGNAGVMLLFDWLAFAVKLALVGSFTARVPNCLVRFGTARRKVKVQ